MKALHILSKLGGKTLFLPALLVMFAITTGLAQVPANDDCSTATLITCGSTTNGSTLNANIDAAPLCGDMTIARNGVWYRIVGQGGMITLSTCNAGTNFDTQIGVYTGSCAVLSCVAGNNNASPACGANDRASSVTFQSTAGTTYYIWVTGVLSTRGNFVLSATCTTPVPANDLCAGAIAVNCGQTVTGTTVGATSDAVGTCTTALGTAPGVWYTVTGNGGSITASLCGSSYDTKIGVFTGSCGSFTCVAGNDDFCSLQSQVTFASTAGTTYYILVTGFSTASGAFSLAVTCPVPGTCNCTNTSRFPTAAVPAPTGTNTVTITTIQWAGEYAEISGAEAGRTYVITSSVATDYITVRTGSSSGPSLACGTTPLTITTTAAGSLFVHFNTNASCGTQNTGRTTTITCTSCSAPPPGTCACNNGEQFGSIAAPTVPNPATITTLQWAGEYAIITGAVAGRTYVFTSSVATDFLTVRQGTPGGTALGCSTTPLTVTATANGNLYLHINTSSACGGDQSIFRTTTVACSSCVAPPNPCLTATPIACGQTVSGTTVGGAPAALAPPTCGTTLNTAPGRWHTIVGNGLSISLTTCSAVGFDTKIGVFSGSCASLTCVAGNDDATCSFSGLRSTVTFQSQLGVTYYVYVTGFSTATGAYELTANCRRTPFLASDESGEAALAGEVVSLPEGALTIGEVFPNPMSGSTANIRVDSPKETEAVVRFMDQMGREVMMIESDLNVGENLLQLNISRLPAGTYFMMVQVEGQVIPRRLVVPRS